MKRRLTSFLLTAMLAFGMISASALADETDIKEVTSEDTVSEAENISEADLHGLEIPAYTEDGEYYMGETEDEDELSASTQSYDQWSNSKKGIQENTYRYDPDYLSLGVKHVLRNITINNYIYKASDGSYHLDTDTLSSHYENAVRTFVSEGVSVTLVILMDWSNDSDIQQLIYAGGRTAGKKYYELNTQDSVGYIAWNNIFNELVDFFSDDDCHIDRYVLGNEVNQNGDDGYNYTGTTDLVLNASAYASAFAVLSRAIQNNYPSAGAYISLDHSWNYRGTGHSAREFLDLFVANMNFLDPSLGWNIAFHAYAPSLRAGSSIPANGKYMWASSDVTDSVDSTIVCGANLSVLTDYVKEKWGSSHRIILAEQGYDAIESDADQAAFIAYTFYAAQFNDMVDAVLFRSYIDNEYEDNLKFGLVNGSESELSSAYDTRSYIASHKRQSYDVFKYMDSDDGIYFTSGLLSVIGASSWSAIIPNFNTNLELKEGFNYKDGNIIYVENGQVYTGWKTIDGKTYYFEPKTGGAARGTVLIDGNKYWFDSNGVKQTGWLEFYGMKLYFDPDNDGIAVTGLYVVDNDLRVFDGNGMLWEVAGTPAVGNKKYWVGEGGKLLTGWLNLGDWKLYFDPAEYYAYTGLHTIDGKVYLFDNNGVMQAYAGTTLVNGKKYWFSDDGGSLRSGWMVLGDWKLYFDPVTYEAATGTVLIGGQSYTFNADGVLIS